MTVLLLLPLPVFVWAAVRFGTGGVSVAMLGFAFLVIWSVGPRSRAVHRASPLEAALPPAVPDAAGRAVLLLAALVQERRADGLRARRRESQYRSIVDSTGDGILVTDLANSVVAVNPAFCTISGYSAEQLRPRHPRDFLHLDDLQPFDSYLARTETADAVTAGVMCVMPGRAAGPARAARPALHYGGRPCTCCRWCATSPSASSAMRLLEQKVAERTRELSTLLEISNTVASTLELKSVLRVVLDQMQIAARLHGRHHPVVDGDELVILDHRGPLTAEQIEHARLPAQWAIARAQELRQGQPAHHRQRLGRRRGRGQGVPRVGAAGDDALLSNARSLMLVPLKARDRSIGLLLARQRRPGQFGTCATARWPGRWPIRRRSRSKTRGSTIRRASWPRSRSASGWRASCTTPSPRACTRRRCWGWCSRGLGPRSRRRPARCWCTCAT